MSTWPVRVPPYCQQSHTEAPWLQMTAPPPEPWQVSDEHLVTSPVNAVHASSAVAAVKVLGGLQSKNVPPMPFECCVWHAPLQQPPTVPCDAMVAVEHSQPSGSGAVEALQSTKPVLQV